MLKYLSSQGKWDRVRDVIEVRVAHLADDLLVVQVVEALQDVLFDYPEVFGIDLQPHIPRIERRYRLLQILQEIVPKFIDALL